MWWLLLVLAGLLIWFTVTYNRFIRLKNLIEQAWSDVDVQLKLRHDLIPKLVDIVKGYAAYEQDTLQRAIDARSLCMAAGDTKNRIAAEQQLDNKLTRLIALAEDYPDLKADQAFLDLQKQVSKTEERIQMARRFYNGAVKMYNVLLDSFPALIVGRMFHFQKQHYFSVDERERGVPKSGFQAKK